MVSPTPGAWARVRRLWRHGLVTHAVLGKLARLGLRVTPYLVYREPPSTPAPRRLAGLTVEPITDETLARTVALIGDDASVKAERWRKALRRGQRGFVLRRGTDFIGYAWADLHVCRLRRARRPLDPTEAYLRDTFVARRHRGRQLAVLLRQTMYRALAAEGRERFLSASGLFNTPARRFKTRLGARPTELRVQMEVRGWWRELCLWRAR